MKIARLFRLLCPYVGINKVDISETNAESIYLSILVHVFRPAQS
jgi:hypothetical protein